VIVTGRLRLREWQNADRAGMSIEVDADVLGHDLNWGTAKYMRTMSGAEFAGGTPDAFGAPPEGDSGSERDGDAGDVPFAPDSSEDSESSSNDAESSEALAATPF